MGHVSRVGARVSVSVRGGGPSCLPSPRAGAWVRGAGPRSQRGSAARPEVAGEAGSLPVRRLRGAGDGRSPPWAWPPLSLPRPSPAGSSLSSESSPVSSPATNHSSPASTPKRVPMGPVIVPPGGHSVPSTPPVVTIAPTKTVNGVWRSENRQVSRGAAGVGGIAAGKGGPVSGLRPLALTRSREPDPRAGQGDGTPARRAGCWKRIPGLQSGRQHREPLQGLPRQVYSLCPPRLGV